MTERADQFDERDQLEQSETPADEQTGEQGPDAFAAPEGGEPV